jgi:hypothetical protein
MLFDAPFQISFVTLEIQAGVGYEWSADASVGPEHVNACGKQYAKPAPPSPKIGIEGKIEPSGKLEAVVEAYASIAGLAGIGVEVDLELLGIGLPVEAEFYLGKPDPVKNADVFKKYQHTIGFGADTSLNMDFHTMDGSLRLYAELLFMKLFDVEIVHWNGFHKTVPIFNAGAFLPVLDGLDTLGNIGLNDPSAMLNNL